MFDVKKTTIKENLIFFIVSIIIISITILLTFSFENSLNYKDEDLAVDGDNNIKSLVINEIMSANKGAHADIEGNIYDWIELYNGESKTINLKNYSLTDDENEVKWVFPDIEIQPNQYLIVYLSGENKEGLYAPFKLTSAGGERLALTDASKKVLDAVETISLKNNHVLARDLDGNWITSSMPTPGYINTQTGLEEYQNSLLSDSLIKINEILPQNDGNFKNEDGLYSGYIEIINTSTEIINLKSYSVSNSILSPFEFQLPDVNLNPNEVYLIYTDTHISELTYANFSLSNKTGEAILSNAGKIVDRVEYVNLANGMALLRNNEQFFESNNISPGFSNTEEGATTFATTYLKNNAGLIINEVMNNNFEYLGQNGNQFYDWIELKNNSSENINLQDYYLSTNETLNTYKLPDITLTPGQVYVIMASGETNLSNNTYYHANFKIGDVESIYILKDKQIIDSMFIANIPLGYSYGRSDANGFYYMESPTPNQNNSTGVMQIAYTPINSVEPGVYNDASLTIELTSNGTIYYTLDGSDPTNKSNVYSSPILVDKTTVIKYVSHEANKLPSDINTASYIVNENHTMPVMSIVTNQADFNYLQKDAWDEELEIEVNAQLYEDGSSFDIDCGLKLFGGSVRGMPKKSFQLKFRSEYGEAKLNYQVFDNRDFSSFNSLVLRSGSQDYEEAFIRDVLATSLVDEYTDVDVQAYKPVILYINGQYWGVYNIREKTEAEFISNHYNVDESADIVRIDGNVTSGSSSDYYDLIRYVNSHDLMIQSNYEYVKTQVDIVNLIDFWIAEAYTSNNDIVNMRFFSHPDVDDGKWNFIFYDLDFAFYNITENYFTFATNPEGMTEHGYSTDLLRNLMRNQEFKNTFVERLSYNMANTWNKEIVLAQIDEIYNYYLPEMERDKIRWGSTLEDWQDGIDDLKNFVEKRETYFLRYIKSYFGLTTAQMEEYF